MRFVEIFMPNKILVLNNRKNNKKILRIHVKITCGIKNLTLYTQTHAID